MESVNSLPHLATDTFSGPLGVCCITCTVACLIIYISCVCIRVSVGVDFQEELSDMLLLKMLQAATQASADKDRVRLSHLSATPRICGRV